jgi:hypothetical protein
LSISKKARFVYFKKLKKKVYLLFLNFRKKHLSAFNTMLKILYDSPLGWLLGILLSACFCSHTYLKQTKQRIYSWWYIRGYYTTRRYFVTFFLWHLFWWKPEQTEYSHKAFYLYFELFNLTLGRHFSYPNGNY